MLQMKQGSDLFKVKRLVSGAVDILKAISLKDERKRTCLFSEQIYIEQLLC